MAVMADEKYMRMALELAEKGRGKTTPNPMVGAVLVKNGRVIGQGYHKKAGTPHAEIHALRQAGSKARGSTLYITLEPCCHYGRTGPCSRAIISAGVKEVVYAITDPNPKVKGKGGRQLRQAGVIVRHGVMAKEASKINESYLKYLKTGRPFAILKLAMTLDGRIASLNGDSRWVTGETARAMVHRLRAGVDAVVIGAQTANIDNPQLTVRAITGNNPYRIILSSHKRLRNNLKLFSENKDFRTIVATSGGRVPVEIGKNSIIWKIEKKGNQLSLDDFLEKAGRFGLTSLLIEGGSRLATAFIKKGLIDKYVFMLAPKILGEGIAAVGDLGRTKMSQALSLKDWQVEKCGEDLMITAYPGK